jgi:hypothetical protein
MIGALAGKGAPMLLHMALQLPFLHRYVVASFFALPPQECTFVGLSSTGEREHAFEAGADFAINETDSATT